MVWAIGAAALTVDNVASEQLTTKNGCLSLIYVKVKCHLTAELVW